MTSRSAAVAVARTLREAGFVAYFAGGCVRDRLMGHEPDDFDIATDARPEQIRAVFPRAQGVGAAFGVMLVRRGGHQIEVATFRSDGTYSDGRRPDQVHFADARQDAQRRDFTINGLFEDPETGVVIDFVDGRADLARRVIRAIGDPELRLSEDRLRMLRAVRFASRFGFQFDPATADAVRRGAGRLEGVSRERIGHELRRMLAHPSRAGAADLIESLALDVPSLHEPSLRSQAGSPKTYLAGLPPEAGFALAMAAWLLDRERVDPTRGASERANGWTGALVLSNVEHDAIVASTTALEVIRTTWLSSAVALRKRWAARPGFDDGLALLAAVDPAAALQIGHELSRLAATGIAPEPLLTGDDLVRSGMVPGPRFRELLDAAYDAQLEGRIGTPDAALEFVRNLARLPP